MFSVCLAQKYATLWVVAILFFGLVACSVGPINAADSRGRSYVAGNFFLILDNVKCGFVKSIDGGAISAEVINEPPGQSYFTKKHIGQPKYESISMQIGFGMSKAVYDWIAGSWSMNNTRKSGGIVVLDYNYQGTSETQFFNALVTETTIPACDASGKDPAYITIKFAPEYTRSASPEEVKTDLGKSEQKTWLPLNFKLTIDGLDCTKVSKIDSFTVKQSAVTDDIGDARDYQKEPGKLEFPNLKISFSEVTAKSWYDWHKEFVIKGNNDESKEKHGTLTFYGPNMQDELARIELYNLGIFRIGAEKAEANSDQIKRVTAELYCERMEFKYSGKGIPESDKQSTERAVAQVVKTTADR
ncbi:MAG: phage tail protein [Chloroflexi bacterium]|nr:phage tail protein [Chloroflexota bacterium]MCL5105386.1 phage tail protein [Armatimonadota bacterium]